MSNVHYILDLDDDLIEDASWSPTEEEQTVISFADGFVTAVALCPEDIPHQEWIAALREDEPLFEDWGGVGRVVDVMRIQKREIDRSLRRDGCCHPYFVMSDEEEPVYASWIIGFLKAMAMRADAWRLYAEGEEGDMAVSSLVLLGAVVSKRKEALGEFDTQTLADVAAAGPLIIIGAIKSLAEKRKALGLRPRSTAMRDKLGRNDPCPCGSGKKFKKCCARAQ